MKTLSLNLDTLRGIGQNFPLKLSTKAFRVGLPGWMKCNWTRALIRKSHIRTGPDYGGTVRLSKSS